MRYEKELNGESSPFALLRFCRFMPVRGYAVALSHTQHVLRIFYKQLFVVFS